jgi:hypothetical protein
MFNQNCDLLTVYAYLKDHKADTLDSVVKVVEGFAARHGSDELRILRPPATPASRPPPTSW